AAGCRYLQSALGGGLAPDIGEVCFLRCARAHERDYIRTSRRNGILAEQMATHLEQGPRPADLQSFDYGRLGDIGVRNQNAAETGRPRGQSHRESTPHGPQISFEPDLAQHHVLLEAVFRELTAGHQNAERDGQVEGRAVFANVGGSKVDGDPAEGKTKARVYQGRTHSFPALLYGAVRQPDCRERGQSVGYVHLNIHRIGIDAEYGGGTDSGEQGSESVIRKEEPQGRPISRGAWYRAGANMDRFVQQFSAGVRFGAAQTRPAEYPPSPPPR